MHTHIQTFPFYYVKIISQNKTANNLNVYSNTFKIVLTSSSPLRSLWKSVQCKKDSDHKNSRYNRHSVLLINNLLWFPWQRKPLHFVHNNNFIRYYSYAKCENEIFSSHWETSTKVRLALSDVSFRDNSSKTLIIKRATQLNR